MYLIVFKAIQLYVCHFMRVEIMYTRAISFMVVHAHGYVLTMSAPPGARTQ